MKLTKYKVSVLVVVAVVALGVGTAFANPSSASATCQGGIVYEGHDYPQAGNTVTVKIDGTTVAGFPKTFGTSTSGTVQFPNKTQGHTWSVIWDRFNGTDGDRTQSGSVLACQESTTTTTTTVASTTTTTVVLNTTVITPAPTTTVATPTTVADTPTTVADTPTTVATPTTVPTVFSTVPGLVVQVTTTLPQPQVPGNTPLPETGTKMNIAFVAFILLAVGGLCLLARRPRRA